MKKEKKSNSVRKHNDDDNYVNNVSASRFFSFDKETVARSSAETCNDIVQW